MEDKKSFIKVVYEKEEPVTYEKDGHTYLRKYQLFLHRNKSTNKNIGHFGWYSKKQNKIINLWVKSHSDAFILKDMLIREFHKHRNALTGVCTLYKVKQKLKDEGLLPLRKNGKPLPEEYYDSEFILIKKTDDETFDLLLEEGVSGKKFIVASENFEPVI